MNTAQTNCKVSTDDSLSGYLDGMLDIKSMRRIDSHLMECPACVQELERLEQTKKLLKSMATPSEPPNPMFWADTFRRARLEAEAQPAPAPRFQLWPPQ